MFSYKNKVWKHILNASDVLLTFCCICSFNQKRYIIGVINYCGYQKQSHSCNVYDVKYNEWSQISHTNIQRSYSSCTVFEGKVVVIGGYCSGYSVQAYDYHENEWSYLSDMIEKRFCHATVSMGNKLFVVGGL